MAPTSSFLAARVTPQTGLLIRKLRIEAFSFDKIKKISTESFVNSYLQGVENSYLEVQYDKPSLEIY